MRYEFLTFTDESHAENLIHEVMEQLIKKAMIWIAIKDYEIEIEKEKEAI